MKKILLAIAAIALIAIFATTGCAKKTVELPIVGEVEFPKGYTKNVFYGYPEETSVESTYVYEKGDELIDEDWSRFKYWSTGPEDGMTYTITEDDTTFRDYILIITNPNDHNKLVAIGVQTPDDVYTTYQFFYE